jgi:dTMP kinase
MNKLIVIEGIDGSGKATQAKLLAESLARQGQKVREVSFPNYDSDGSALVRMYLAGEFGEKPSDVNAYAASSFFAVDRYASFMRDWRHDYARGVVIADRYTTSNAVHQCSKLPRDQWEGFLQWLFDYEYHKLGIPTPDGVFYLRVDPEVSQKLIMTRYEGNEQKKDIHEKNMAYLMRCHEAADYCAEKLGWVTVECCEGENLRPIASIQSQLQACASRLL